MDDLTKLPNIGATLAARLHAAGITSHAQLAAMGSIQAMLLIRAEVDPAACMNMLYAIEGAIRGVRWHDLPREHRQELKQAFDRAIRSES